jgi:hypothetical protein
MVELGFGNYPPGSPSANLELRGLVSGNGFEYVLEFLVRHFSFASFHSGKAGVAHGDPFGQFALRDTGKFSQASKVVAKFNGAGRWFGRHGASSDGITTRDMNTEINQIVN